MIQTYQVLPVVAIVCSASAFAQNAADPVQMVKQNIDLISSANKVLDDVKDNAAVEIAIKQLNALTQQAKQLDKSMEKMKLTSEQAIRIDQIERETPRTPSWTCWKIASDSKGQADDSGVCSRR